MIPLQGADVVAAMGTAAAEIFESTGLASFQDSSSEAQLQSADDGNGLYVRKVLWGTRWHVWGKETLGKWMGDFENSLPAFILASEPAPRQDLNARRHRSNKVSSQELRILIAVPCAQVAFSSFIIGFIYLVLLRFLIKFCVWYLRRLCQAFTASSAELRQPSA